jgi:hypothetical protein
MTHRRRSLPAKKKGRLSPAKVDALMCRKRYAFGGQMKRRGRSRAEKSYQHCGCYAPAAQRKGRLSPAKVFFKQR